MPCLLQYPSVERERREKWISSRATLGQRREGNHVVTPQRSYEHQFSEDHRLSWIGGEVVHTIPSPSS